MCANMENGCCEACAGRTVEPELMNRMARTLGVDGMLTGSDREAAAGRCEDCSDKDACESWLSVAALRGADHAPRFCQNADTFDAMASEAPATF